MTLCEHCRIKKIAIIPYTCRCGYKELCTLCRLGENHACTFDFKAAGKKIISKNNPIIINKKIIEI